MPPQMIELPFPVKGLNEAWGYGRQPEGTTPSCLNVLPFDPIDSRARGGQRWGLSKYYSTLHNGANALQHITSDAVAATIGEKVILNETFTQANGVLSDTRWWPCIRVGTDWNIDATHPTVSGNKIVLDNTTSPAAAKFAGGFNKTAQQNLQNFEISADATLVCAAVNGEYVQVMFPITMSKPTFPDWDDDPQDWRYMDFKLSWDTTLLYRFHIRVGNDATTLVSATPGSSDWKDPTWWAVARTLKFVVSEDGTKGSLYADDTLIGGPSTLLPFDYRYSGPWWGWTVRKTSHATNAITLDNVIYRETGPQSGRNHTIIAVSGGDIFTGSPLVGLAPTTDGTNVLNTSGYVGAQSAFGNTYFCDGDASHYRFLTLSTNAVSTWTVSITAGVLPCDADNGATTYAIASATSAAKQFTYTGDLTSVISVNDHIKVSGSTANDGVYSVSVIAFVDPTTTITVRQALVDDTADGNIQLASVGCKFMVLYRGRIVLAGLETDPQNWFMSAAGDPLDWDYGVDPPTATMAVAGTDSDLGKCPDIVTCLAPYSDDLMYIGGDHTLWLMRGDPAAGGSIDNVSYQTGIAGPEAFTFDPNGTFYFFGSGSVWRVAPGGIPEPISRNRLDQTFKDIDLTTNTVHLEWDNIGHGLFIFVRPSASGSVTQYYWDERTDSFWPISFPNDHGPTATLAFDGDSPDDNAMLLGGWDGYIRKIDAAADDDDDTAINSYIYYAPVSLGGMMQNTRVSRIIGVLDAESDDVTLTTYAEDTPQGAIESATIRYARELKAGRTQILNRVTGNAIAIKLSNSTDDEMWAIESLLVLAEPTGRTRKYQL